MEKRPLVILAGPTAAGKTDLSIRLAGQTNGAIISADSMQVYRYMDVGSAKVTKEEMQGVPHYLIDALLPSEEFHVVRFQEMAKAALQEIYAKGRLPIVVGGTGFYIQALLYDIDFTEQQCDEAFREEMAAYANTYGARALHEKLKDIDPLSYANIHENNVKRTVRALEYYHQTGIPISAHNAAEQAKESPYRFAYFVLTDERKHLYERIDCRVDSMIERGLLDEVKRLRDMGFHRQMVAMQGLGYKELFDYLDHKCTLEEAIYIIKRETRHFAKRQLTWFKRERDAIWLDRSKYQYDDGAILQDIFHVLEERVIYHE